ncbi:MAG TPA: ADOP family duplicated permease [Myxococcaceae bacterium]|nr:ADOP family duplicated permease [Myxococcaceae bacterium]
MSTIVRIQGMLARLSRRRGFLALTVGVLGLGLGAALSVLEVADALFWRPLPYADADRLVFASQTDARGTRLTVTGADFLTWKSEAEPFASMGAISARGFNLASDGEPERVEGALVSAEVFEVLGARPLLGRLIEPGPPGPRVAVLSESLWRRRFGADPAVLGRTLSLDGEPVQVLGVVPAAFRLPATAQLWVSARGRVPEHPTYPIDPEADRARHFLTVIARLRPGWSPGSAGAALSTLQARMAREFPDEEREVTAAALTPFREQLYGAARPQISVLLGVAALLACVAWVNAAHLFLIRRTRRSHELAVRVALGASRRSLWILFLREAGLIALGAGALAVGLAARAAPLLVAASPQATGLPLPGLSGRVLALAVLLVLATAVSMAVLAGLQPVHTTEQIQEGGRTGTEGRGARRLRAAFLGFEVVLSLLLLLGTGLLLRSYRAVHTVDPGFRSGGVLAVDLPLARLRHPTPASQARFAMDVLRALANDGQVEAAGFVSRLPLSPSNTIGDLALPGQEDAAFPCDLRLASPGYFEALGIPLRSGRLFDARDVEGGPPAAIINELAARRAFGTRSALGQRILIWGERVPSEVVGVVGNVRHTGLDAEPRPEAWRPIGAVGWANLSLVVRGKVPPEALVGSVRAAVHAIDAEQPLVRPEPMAERAAASLAVRRFTLEVLSAGAVVALLLALAGIYGVTAYGVAQRTRELGVRLALGATPRGLVRMVTRETLGVVAAGCIVGLLAGTALSRILSGLLFGVSRLDPLTFLGWPLVLAAVSGGAAWVAARRAASVGPAEALRAE